MSILNFESLYPSLNLNAACIIFYRFLLKHTQEEERSPKVLRELAHLICHDSYFEFEGMFYQQKQGVPIGIPMAGVLAEIIVREVEFQLHSDIRNEMCMYSRYVDNIFIMWERRSMSELVIEHFSKPQYGLKLKLTNEHNETIDFLDIRIILEMGYLETTVFVKLTNTLVLIPVWSYNVVRGLIRKHPSRPILGMP